MTIQLDKPKFNSPLLQRVEGVRKGLLAAHEAGRGAPNEVIGNEREIFVRKYLEVAYPKPYRFSSGYVIDKNDSMTGQLDVVIEKLHSISFPVQSQDGERLFLAEMVSAIISIKSNIYSQWNQICREMEKVSIIRSNSRGTFRVNPSNGPLPVFVVAYSGAKKLKELINKIESEDCFKSIRAVIVLDSNLFAVRTGSGGWTGSDTTSSFLYFICELHLEITNNFSVNESIWEYACEIS